jgi:hypothetical protein
MLVPRRSCVIADLQEPEEDEGLLGEEMEEKTEWTGQVGEWEGRGCLRGREVISVLSGMKGWRGRGRWERCSWMILAAGCGGSRRTVVEAEDTDEEFSLGDLMVPRRACGVYRGDEGRPDDSYNSCSDFLGLKQNPGVNYNTVIWWIVLRR